MFDSDTRPFEPSYRQKEKTEICKNWLRGLCKYGALCAFAHGQCEMQKKTHVAAKYKASLCNSYHTQPYFCQYGSRCQFAHLTRDFSSNIASYVHLLTENVNQMCTRLNNAANVSPVTPPPTMAILNVFFTLSEPHGTTAAAGRRGPSCGGRKAT